jgi:prepilin-type N-terminal cleavage/methylation domain-containing protein
MLIPLRQAVQRAKSDDGGFSLIEVVVALMILGILAAAVSVTLLDGLAVSKAGRDRVAAANLAAREIEIARNQFNASSADALALAASGTTTNPNPLGAGGSEVDGTDFTVTRSVSWLPTGNGVSACDGGSLVNHPSLRVDVDVAWPNMRFAKPITSTTLLTPPKGLLGETPLAFLAVKVLNAAGQPQSGVLVSATGPGGGFTQTTDAAGCAVLQVGAAGTYTVVTDMSGWVDQTGTQRAEKSVVAVQGSLARMQTTYDRAAALDVTVVTDAGYGFPTTNPAINYTRPNVPLASSRIVLPNAGGVTRISGLWPTLDGYSPWAGACDDSDPAGPPTGGSRQPPVVISPGGVGSAQARLAPLQISVFEDDDGDGSGPALSGATVTAYSMACAAGGAEAVLALGNTDAAGELKSSLPHGQWYLQVTHGGDLGVSDPFVPAPTGVTTVDVGVDG